MKTERSPFDDAMLDAALEEFKDVPEHEEDIDFPFSPEFLERADRLLEEEGRRHTHRFGKTARRILLAAAIIILLAATAMAVPAIRKAILGFFVTDTGPDLRFTFDGAIVENAPSYINTVYRPSYIPEGYTSMGDGYEDTNVGFVGFTWEDASSGGYIDYTQIPLPEDLQKNGYDGDVDRIEYKNLGEYEVLCTYSQDGITYCWTNYEYFFTLIATALPDEELEKIFYSVQIDPNAVIEGIEGFE